MPPEQNTTPDVQQPTPESPSPATEPPASPTPATEPATPPQEASPGTTAPEAPPAPVEEVPAPDSTSSPQVETAPVSAEATTGTQPATSTGQMAGNDPLSPEPDPIPPPSSAAAQAQPTIVPQSPVASVPIVVPPTGNFIRNLLAKASAKIQSKKKAKLEKILQALTKKNKITNDEVEKLLHVSDATAERYLSTLVKEGKIKQDRKTGAGVAYTKI